MPFEIVSRRKNRSYLVMEGGVGSWIDDESRSSLSGGLKLRSAKTTSFWGRVGLLLFSMATAEEDEGESTVMGSYLTAIVVSGRSIECLRVLREVKWEDENKKILWRLFFLFLNGPYHQFRPIWLKIKIFLYGVWFNLKQY